MKNKIQIIAEIGVNHNGSFSNIKKLIKGAVKADADFVKFQNWTADKLVTNSAKMAPYQIKNTNFQKSQIEMLKPLELDKSIYPKILREAKKNKIKFLSSPFDEENILFLKNKLQQKIIKIPSGEINNFLMLSKVNIKKDKLFISTGMANLKEIAETLNFIAKSKIYNFKGEKIKIKKNKNYLVLKKNIILMHCVTDYPVKEEFANLKSINTLKNNFQLNVGYSDHTLGIEAPLIAVSLGATLIEKHITLDNNMKGPDHRASLNLKNFEKMVMSIRKYQEMIGDGIKKLQKCEIENLKIARKSLVASKKIIKGEKFTLKNLTVKRPATGVSSRFYFNYIGKKSKYNYQPDCLIKFQK